MIHVKVTINGRGALRQRVLRQMRVSLRCADVGVAEQLLDLVDRATFVHERRGVGMAQIVKADVLQPGKFARLFPAMLNVWPAPMR